ncbi:MAG: PKD domain-containing protein, partial [Anaerolineales bacterium]|nr:PKD domain-containing protein [Anaerolineales bacterium]
MQKSPFSMFFVESKKFEKWGTIRIFADELTSDFNDGPASLNKDEDVIYYNRNMKIAGRLKNTRDSTNQIGIYSTEYRDGEWGNIQSFVYTNPGFSILSPSLATEGTRLYFSSNMPGGFGDFDLYYSDLKENGWQEPVNLGASVNTSKNESYPFESASGKLYFASEGHGGLGGKDLFYTMELDEKWITPVHLSPEINSTADDFGLITTDDLQSGFFSSNRRQSDDIYSFSRNPVQFDTCVEQRENNYCFLFFDDQVKPNDSISVNYEWDFGSDIKIEGRKVKHCFPGPGKYSVLLRVIDNDTGDTINNLKPFEFELEEIEQAYINSISPGTEKETMHFDGLKTNLPDVLVTE